MRTEFWLGKLLKNVHLEERKEDGVILRSLYGGLDRLG
jgi:G:T-mismatch repair DNA endonuclease (very short patch repair protein)